MIYDSSAFNQLNGKRELEMIRRSNIKAKTCDGKELEMLEDIVSEIDEMESAIHKVKLKYKQMINELLISATDELNDEIIKQEIRPLCFMLVKDGMHNCITKTGLVKSVSLMGGEDFSLWEFHYDERVPHKIDALFSPAFVGAEFKGLIVPLPMIMEWFDLSSTGEDIISELLNVFSDIESDINRLKLKMDAELREIETKATMAYSDIQEW